MAALMMVSDIPERSKVPFCGTNLEHAHNMLALTGEKPSPEFSFPYGFPKPGAYRIFVQMKQDGKIETGVFDVKVEN